MPRTAFTAAKTHAGKWVMLGNPDDSIVDQKLNFRNLRADRAHDEFQTVIYQESDGHAQINRLLTRDVLKSQEKQREEDETAARNFDAEQKAVKPVPKQEETKKHEKKK